MTNLQTHTLRGWVTSPASLKLCSVSTETFGDTAKKIPTRQGPVCPPVSSEPTANHISCYFERNSVGKAPCAANTVWKPRLQAEAGLFSAVVLRLSSFNLFSPWRASKHNLLQPRQASCSLSHHSCWVLWVHTRVFSTTQMAKHTSLPPLFNKTLTLWYVDFILLYLI